MTGRRKKTDTKDLENQLKRALADYANLQKRIEQEKGILIKFAKVDLIKKLLHTLDNLEKAEKIIQRENLEFIRQGLDIALREFRKILAEEGVKEIKASGDFDPRFHEAIEVVAGRKDNKIAQIVEKGYQLEEKILRPAKVKVTKKEINQSSPQAQKEIEAGDYM